MDKLIINPTTMSQWQSLVTEASQLCSTSLEEEIESYLVFLLMRYSSSPDIAHNTVALEFLKAHDLPGEQKTETLRAVGDRCLLISGLFPGRARKRHVKISYFVHIGKSAYLSLSEVSDSGVATLFAELSKSFVPMMDVLHSMRELDNNSSSLDPLQATEVWNDTKSPHALQTLHKLTNISTIISENFSSNLKH